MSEKGRRCLLKARLQLWIYRWGDEAYRNLLILSILLDVPYYANLHIRGLPFSLSTPHAVATLQVHGSLRGVNRIRPINFPPISSGTLGTHDSHQNACWFQDIILPIARNVCDYIGIVMENATKTSPP